MPPASEPGRPAAAPKLRPRHIDQVNATVAGEANGLETEVVSHSWRRSAELHHVDAESREPPRILSESRLRQSMEPLERVTLAAQPEMDRLHRIVGHAGYVTLLTDTEGVVVEHRGSEANAGEFRYWGIWLGGVWSEAVEGTNGIGTAIAEARAVTVHQDQHFRARHTSLSCSGAPVFDADARLAAVLDVSSMQPQLSAQAHALTLPLVVDFARQIEERLFRERFARAWILAIAPPAEEGPGSLLAVDNAHRVIGAGRFARRQFGLDQAALEGGVSLWTLFERNSALLQRELRSDYPVQLTCADGGEMLFALISSPVAGSAAGAFGQLDSTLLTRPRTGLLEDLRRQYAPEAARGGLAPGVLRRVRDYIAEHLAESLDVATLAAQAGLSAYHFARAFKASVGAPPRRYLLEQRIRKAADLIETTDEPLTRIALDVGFADQAHFSRSFHALTGLTPSQFRRARR